MDTNETANTTPATCPAPIEAEAKEMWRHFIGALRRDGSVQMGVAAYKHDAERESVELMGVILPEEITESGQMRDQLAATIRATIRDSGANMAITVADVWTTENPHYQPRHDPKRKEMLVLNVELRGVGSWGASAVYKRIGNVIFVSDEFNFGAMPCAGGRFGNWFADADGGVTNSGDKPKSKVTSSTTKPPTGEKN